MGAFIWLIILLFVCAPAWAQTDAAKSQQDEPPTLFGVPVSSVSDDDQDSTKTWGVFDPGKGFLVGKSSFGTLSLSGYMLIRYLNQLPPDQTFTDHLGREHALDTRNDIQLHRQMIWLKGWIYSPNLTYTLTVWGVNSINEVALPGFINYEFNKNFTLGGGIEGLPGIRSLNGQHPYFLGTDRQMAEDFFRPGFTSGVWIRGELFPKTNYRVMVGDNLSQVGISAAQMTRDLAYGATFWWMPTTGEFGPRGGYGDYEIHEKLATRFGVSTTYSREDRFNEISISSPDNTQLRLSDGTLLFETGSLAPGVTVQKSDYNILSVDAGMKHRGFFAHAEYYLRWLSRFQADGPLPLDSMFDHGFEILASHQVLPKKFELYGAFSYVFGEFNRSWETTLGGNFYPFNTRNFRMNGSLSYVDKSPYGSLFGYFLAGQTGPIVALSSDVFF